MVRATYSRVLARLGGSYPSGWDQTKVEDLCAQADYIIDGYTYPETISTTNNVAIELAVDVVLRMMSLADYMQEHSGSAGHDGRSYPVPTVLTSEIKERIDRLLSGSSIHGITTVDMFEE